MNRILFYARWSDYFIVLQRIYVDASLFLLKAAYNPSKFPKNNLRWAQAMLFFSEGIGGLNSHTGEETKFCFSFPTTLPLQGAIIWTTHYFLIDYKAISTDQTSRPQMAD